MKEASPPPLTVEICILAGGASSRMGSDKARLRLGRRTMLGIIREQARQVPNTRLRVIRRDLVERCGPLGGIYTALKTTRAEAVLFLACDMPLVKSIFLQKLFAHFADDPKALFVQSDSAGFPFVLPKTVLPVVEEQMAARELSIHRLCRKLGGHLVIPDKSESDQLFNVNTAADLSKARERLGLPSLER